MFICGFNRAMLIQHTTSMSPSVYGLEVNLISITGNCSNLFTYKHFCHYYTCFQNQIIHKHVHMNYNPLKGMLILILSLKLSIVPYAAGPESRGHSKTTFANISMLPKFHCSLDFTVI